MANEIDYTTLSSEELVKIIQAKDAQLANKDSELATSAEVIGELKEDLSKKDEEILTASAVPTVKVGKDTYEIVIPFFKFYDTEERLITDYTTRDVQKNDKLAAALVKMGSGVLQKISKK